MRGYADILFRLLEESRPRDALGVWTDLALVLYALWKDEETLPAAERCERWDVLVQQCARRLYDLPLDDWQPQKGLSADCTAYVQAILRGLAKDRRTLAQNAADLLDELLQKMIDGESIYALITPQSLADLMVSMALPQGPCQVLDPICGSGRLLLAAHRVNPEASLKGIEHRKPLALAALLRLRLGGMWSCKVDNQTDILHLSPYCRERFDLILANPPYESDLRSTIGYIYAFLEVLKPGGRCAVLVPEGLLNNTVQLDAVELRKHLLRFQALEAVISLPIEIYRPHTISHSSLLLFRKGPGRREVFFGRIPNQEGPERGASDQAYRPDMNRVLHAWSCWSAGKLLPEEAAGLCWTASLEDIEHMEGYMFSAEQYRTSTYIHPERQPGELEQALRCQCRLEELLLQYMAEQEAWDGL